MDTHSWSKRKLIRFSIITCLLVLLLGEIVFRIVFYFEYRNYNTSLDIQGNSIQMSDSLLVFRNRPFYLDYNRRFQYNEEGMKSEPGDVSMPVKNDSDFWVFLFGASAMEGMGSNNDGEWLDITGVRDHTASTSIGAYLEKMVQQQMPGKRVKVFTAANSSFMLCQSVLRYRDLSTRYKMDWVISMDGQNEPDMLDNGMAPMDVAKEWWKENPVSQYPLKFVTGLTSHSALVNKIKQWIYSIKASSRLEKASSAGFPRRTYWFNAPAPSVQFTGSNAGINRAVDAFYKELKQWDSTLTQQQQPHLLLIQPHLAFRDPQLMDTTEKALYHYYCSAYNDTLRNTFFRQVYSSFDNYFSPAQSQVQLLTTLNGSAQPVFVDYCHFNREINKWLAKQIAGYILSSGSTKL